MPRIPNLLLAAATAIAALAQNAVPPPRVTARQFPIMAWGGTPSDPARLAEMRDAGLNVTGFCNPKQAAAVRDAGLSCFLQDIRISGVDWKNLPADDKLRASLADVVQAVAGNPAVIGYYLKDEPAASEFPGLARMARLVEQAAPGAWPYVNLLPTYANAQQLGTPDYKTHVAEALRVIRPPFLSYDHYSVTDGELSDRFFQNLDLIRAAALEAKVPFWNCILSTAMFNHMEPSDATLRLQVYATLAYGGRGIQYFTYHTPPMGNYRLAAIDAFGNRTATWDALRRVSLELHALAPQLLKLHSTGVYHSPFLGSPLLRSVTTSNRERDRFLIGEFADERGRPYVMIVNKSLSTSFNFRVEFPEGKHSLIRVSNYTGKEQPMGPEMNWLAPGAGVLLRIE